MIFAHGPLGFCVALVLRSLWKKYYFSKARMQLLLWLGFVAGILPDIDLFYFYLVNAESSHRSLPTHFPIFYIVLCGCFSLYALLRKKYFLMVASITVFFGAISHLLADGIFAQVHYLYPFSHEFYGLTDVLPAYVVDHMLSINLILEGTIIALFLYTLIRLYAHDLRIRLPLIALTLSVYVFGVSIVYIGDSHIAHIPHAMYYKDLDNDGVLNIKDRDMDNDGILNIDDEDSDNDGESNPFEIVQFADELHGAWYDPTDGGLLRIPIRLGFLTNRDTPGLLFDAAGISLRVEMTVDYHRAPDGYETSPDDEQFDRNRTNIRSWLTHQGRLEFDNYGRLYIGDLLFFESGYIAVVTGFDTAGQPRVLDVQKNRIIQERLVAEVSVDEGQIQARAKMLNSGPLFD